MVSVMITIRIWDLLNLRQLNMHLSFFIFLLVLEECQKKKKIKAESKLKLTK